MSAQKNMLKGRLHEFYIVYLSKMTDKGGERAFIIGAKYQPPHGSSTTPFSVINVHEFLPIKVVTHACTWRLFIIYLYFDVKIPSTQMVYYTICEMSILSCADFDTLS